MKQILLSLLALLGVSTMTMADGSTSWRFDDATQWSDWQTGDNYTVSGVEVKNDLIFYAGSDTKVVYQTSGGTCLVGSETITYSNRLQLGGGGQVGTSAKTLLGVPVDGACKISVVAAAAGSTNSRYLKAGYTSETDLTQVSALTPLTPEEGYLTYNNSEENNCLFSFEYDEEDETVIYLYSSTSGINIFEITVEALGTDPEEPEANVYACSMTFDISALDLSTARYFYVRVVDNNGDGCWNIGFSDVVVTIDDVVYDFSGCEGYDVASYLKLFEEWGATPVSTTVPSDAQTMVVAFNLYDLWNTWGGSFGEDVIKDYSFVVQINDGAYNQIDVAFSGTELLEGAIYPPTSTAISNVNVEATEVARYNLMGQKISGAEKGINIIVYSDGSAKKVLVK